MRAQFCEAMVARSATSDMIFLTGDLGFMALEPLQEALGKRFINAGVSEQNMISVSGALARQGYEVWAYSIASFCYARPFEQIRNDIAFPNLSVKLVGNGGGYGYGVQGPTHHAIEDYGVLLTLPGMSVLVPVFDEDLPAVVERAGGLHNPTYLRLGRGEKPKGFEPPAYEPWRQLTTGSGITVIAVGPLAGTYIEAFQALPESERPTLWAVSELPLERNPLPVALLAQIENSAGVCVAEEHVKQGGFASSLALHLSLRGIHPKAFRHLHALAHVYDRYGSQPYLREKSKLDVRTMLATVS
jgi:transketolase